MSKPLDELVEDYRDRFGDFPTTWDMEEPDAVSAIEGALESGVALTTAADIVGDRDPEKVQL